MGGGGRGRGGAVASAARTGAETRASFQKPRRALPPPPGPENNPVPFPPARQPPPRAPPQRLGAGAAGGRGLLGAGGAGSGGSSGPGCPRAEGPGPPGGQPSPARSGPLRRLRAPGLRPRRRPSCVSLGKRKVGMPGGGKLRAVGAVRAFPGSQSRIHCCCFHLSQHRRQKLSVCRSAAGSLPGCGRGADEQMRPPKNEATGRQEMRGEHPRDPHLAQRPRHLVAPPWPSRCALSQNRSSGAERGRRVQAGGFVGSRRHAAPPGRGLRAQSRAGWP